MAKLKPYRTRGPVGEHYTGIAVIIVLIVLVARLAITGAAIWAIVWGASDWVAQGFNAWALVWIILGSLTLLGNISAGKGK